MASITATKSRWPSMKGILKWKGKKPTTEESTTEESTNGVKCKTVSTPSANLTCKTVLGRTSTEWNDKLCLTVQHAGIVMSCQLPHAIHDLAKRVHEQINEKHQFSVNPSNPSMLQGVTYRVSLDDYKWVVANEVGKSISQLLSNQTNMHFILEWIDTIQKLTRNDMHRLSQGYDSIFNYTYRPGTEASYFRDEVYHQNKEHWIALLHKTN